MAFVPEGQADSSQARSAWNHEKNSLVPAGRLIGSRLRSGARQEDVIGPPAGHERDFHPNAGCTHPRNMLALQIVFPMLSSVLWMQNYKH